MRLLNGFISTMPPEDDVGVHATHVDHDEELNQNAAEAPESPKLIGHGAVTCRQRQGRESAVMLCNLTMQLHGGGNSLHLSSGLVIMHIPP